MQEGRGDVVRAVPSGGATEGDVELAAGEVTAVAEEAGTGDGVCASQGAGSSGNATGGDAELAPAQVPWVPGEVATIFHMVPRKGWDSQFRAMRCGARNTMTWKGRPPLPEAPHPCWLVPTSDATSVRMAELQTELRSLGWKVLTSSPHVVRRLCNKSLLQDVAREVGVSEHFPVRYQTEAEAKYPCILKSALGEFGKDCHIVESSADTERIAPRGLGVNWVLQELVQGHFEYAVSLLVLDGRILHVIGTKYEYESAAYVYPKVVKVGKAPYSPLPEHISVMQELLHEYSGICNFNYKLREDNSLAIFEINTRVGADLVFDVRKEKARELFLKLDSILKC